MLKILVAYPSEQEELEIVRLTTAPHDDKVHRVLDAAAVGSLQEMVRRFPCGEQVMKYALRLARGSRPDAPEAPRYVRDYVAWGAGPRASQFLVLTAKARALLCGRHHVGTDDIAALVHPVLRHRIVMNFNAEADGVTSDQMIERLLQDVPRIETPGLDALGAERVFAR
jgi:MoxR-like ATPase